MTIKNIEKNILRLNPAARIRIVEGILASLNKPDPAIERAWGLESEKRLTAFKNGKAKSINFEIIKKRFTK